MAHRALAVVRGTPPTPRRCRVCDDSRVVLIVRSLDPALTGGGPSQCPKCCGSVVRPPIPIYRYPMRDDTPKDAA